jgi:DNA-binding YbaB/EbfC family protein
MTNIGQIMKQAQQMQAKMAEQMQAKMAELQEQLADLEVHGAAGGDMVQVTMNGKGVLRAVKIDPSLINADDAAVLEDLIVAAVNDAKRKVEGMSLPL